jgi:hypothetical protein
VREPRVTQVTVGVDQARDNDRPIHHTARGWHGLIGGDEPLNLLAFHGDGSLEPAPGRVDARRADQQVDGGFGHQRQCILHAP